MGMGKIIGIVLLCLVGLGSTVIAVNVVSTATTVATAPGRVLQKTLGTDNIINNYEWFHDVDGRIRSRVEQITSYSKTINDAETPKDRARVRMEVAAMRQSCRDMVNQYNANANKSNRGLFRGWSLPERHEAGICE